MKTFWEMNKAQQEQFLAEAAKEAIAKTHAAGRPTTHADEDGRLYKLYPDGKRVYVTEQK